MTAFVHSSGESSELFDFVYTPTHPHNHTPTHTHKTLLSSKYIYAEELKKFDFAY
jgi:hypothetical protein